MRDDDHMRMTRSALAILFGIAGVAASVLAQDTTRERVNLAVVGVPGLLYLCVGLLILHAHPGHPVGRLTVLGPLIATTGTGLLEVSVTGLHDRPHDALTLLGATLGATGRGLGWLVLVLVLPLVFPDGQRSGPPRILKWAWRLSLTALSVNLIVSLLSPTQTDLRIDRLDNPIGVPHALSAVFGPLSLLLLVSASATIVLAMMCVASRWRHGGVAGLVDGGAG